MVLDALALLAFLFDEPGADAVAKLLPRVSSSAVNYAETLSKPIDQGRSLADSVGHLNQLRLSVVPFDAELAAVAALLRPVTKPSGHSLGDRTCLALGLARNLPVVTGHREWKHVKIGVSVRCVR